MGLYGPPGSGKTMLAQAVAYHTGAMFLDLSPKNLVGKYEGSKGPIMLAHMAWACARKESWAPVVIYIDEVEQIFAGGRKGDSAGRFKKPFADYKDKWMEADNQCIVSGNCREPWKLSTNNHADLKRFFDKFLYIPWP